MRGALRGSPGRKAGALGGGAEVGGEGGRLLRTHSLVRMLMGYMTGMLVVAELSSRRPESSLLLQGAR